jgi:GrpB-like predicted nucleotidyltransferase (UPF0157 family)
MLQFHDWLGGNAGDRRLYERVKRELTGRAWTSCSNTPMPGPR